MARECVKPIIKWAGGKTQLLPELTARVDQAGLQRTYFEPFAGGAALFFKLAALGRINDAVLGDTNTRLIEMYRAVRADVEGVIAWLTDFKREHSEAFYYRMRDSFNIRPAPGVEQAARFIYLNKTCFNGLYRVNRKGEFNVPFGAYKNPGICDEDGLRLAASALRLASLITAGFKETVKTAKSGDFVYFDPPYVPVSKTANFTGYSGAFGETEQRQLATLFRALGERGVKVMLSNSDTPLVRELYAGCGIETVSARRAINSKAGKRGAVGEVIVRHEPLALREREARQSERAALEQCG